MEAQFLQISFVHTYVCVHVFLSYVAIQCICERGVWPVKCNVSCSSPSILNEQTKKQKYIYIYTNFSHSLDAKHNKSSFRTNIPCFLFFFALYFYTLFLRRLLHFFSVICSSFFVIIFDQMLSLSIFSESFPLCIIANFEHFPFDAQFLLLRIFFFSFPKFAYFSWIFMTIINEHMRHTT